MISIRALQVSKRSPLRIGMKTLEFAFRSEIKAKKTLNNINTSLTGFETKSSTRALRTGMRTWVCNASCHQKMGISMWIRSGGSDQNNHNLKSKFVPENILPVQYPDLPYLESSSTAVVLIRTLVLESWNSFQMLVIRLLIDMQLQIL